VTLAWLLWTVGLIAFLGALLLFGRWALRHLEISFEMDPPRVKQPLGPLTELLQSDHERNYALARAVLTDVIKNEGASELVTTLSREELQLALIGAGGFLGGCMEVLGAQFGKSGADFWSGFCIAQERGDQP